MRRASLAALFLAVAAVGYWGWAVHQEGQQAIARDMPKVLGIFGGESSMAILQSPARVEAFRLGPLPQHIQRHEAKVSDYPTTFGPVMVPEQPATEIAAVLSKPNSYLWGKTVSCIPAYGVKLSFHRGVDRLDLIICYSCGIIRAALNGKDTGSALFREGRPVLVRAAKQLFPDDEIVQSIPENETRGDL